jgi:hypothetical protein
MSYPTVIVNADFGLGNGSVSYTTTYYPSCAFFKFVARLEQMPQRSSKQPDFVQNARRMVDESTRPHETPAKLNPSLISQVMAEMGRKGGKAGGKSRMESMGVKGRSEFGRAAVNARWAKYRADKTKA